MSSAVRPASQTQHTECLGLYFASFQRAMALQNTVSAMAIYSSAGKFVFCVQTLETKAGEGRGEERDDCRCWSLDCKGGR